jgi:UMF1 family MFS transporter
VTVDDKAAASAVDPALGAESGNPPIEAAADAEGFAVWFRARKEAAATGGGSASPVGQVSWALYEWSRNPYILVVWIYLFTPYFVNFVVGDGVRGQAIAGEIQTYSGFGIAVLAPFLGAIADRGGRRKPWIALYTAIMIAAMLPMWFAMPHADGRHILYVGVMIAAANISYEFSAVFHNSLLPTIASERRIAGLSGLGLSLGNAAGIIILLFMLIAFALPTKVGWGFIPSHPLFGVDQALHEPERLSGPICALWLFVFSMPLFFFTPDQPSSNMPLGKAMIGGVKSVIATIRSLKHYRNVGAYLLARLFFNDGMTAVLVFGGIYASTTFHWGPIQMLSYGVELSIFAVLGGFVGGWLDNTFGSKRAIFISIGGTTLFGLLSLTMAPDRIFWFIPYSAATPHVWSLPFFNTWPEIVFLIVVNFIAVLITAGYANSRTMLARIAPPEKMAEFFGLYSLSGQSTSFLATGLVTWLTLISHNQRIGLLGETVFLVIGLILMFFVREERVVAI